MKIIPIILFILFANYSIFAKSISIGIVQLEQTRDIDLNKENIFNALKLFQEESIDIIIFPEAATTSYYPNLDFQTIYEIIKFCKQYSRTTGISILLPSFHINREQHAFNNAIYFINKHGDIENTFYKEGITESEMFFLKPSPNVNRSVIINGFTLGIIICREIADGPWEYLNPDVNYNAIIWPGFWGWDTSTDWDNEEVLSTINFSSKIFTLERLIENWKAPIIQVNYLFPPHKFTGGSLVTSKDGDLFLMANKTEQKLYILKISDKNEIVENQFIH